jgi:hypothetical protein
MYRKTSKRIGMPIGINSSVQPKASSPMLYWLLAFCWNRRYGLCLTFIVPPLSSKERNGLSMKDAFFFSPANHHPRKPLATALRSETNSISLKTASLLCGSFTCGAMHSATSFFWRLHSFIAATTCAQVS